MIQSLSEGYVCLFCSHISHNTRPSLQVNKQEYELEAAVLLYSDSMNDCFVCFDILQATARPTRLLNGGRDATKSIFRQL